MIIKRAVLLGYSLFDYKSDLKEGDLVMIDNGYDDRLFTINKIDPRFGKRKDEPDTVFKYLIKGVYNVDQYINFERGEISKAHLAFFDYHKYYKEGKRVFLGGISSEDLNYIKAKHANELEIPFSEFDTIKLTDLIDLDFYGSTYNKEYYNKNNTEVTVVQYFKIDKPE